MPGRPLIGNDREGAFPPPLSRQSREIHPSARRVARPYTCKRRVSHALSILDGDLTLISTVALRSHVALRD
jgi:hypothetical protein